jgi:hypothetical protein|tara:strand:- start:2049 stop:2195 length:147 start_codon:yes stop_codon:yes gene_type:complete
MEAKGISASEKLQVTIEATKKMLLVFPRALFLLLLTLPMLHGIFYTVT